MKINPNCLFALYRYTIVLTIQGQFSEALKILQQLLIIDPLSLITYKRIGKVFYKMGRPANAIVYLKDALELESTDWESLMLLGASFAELGNFEESLNIFKKCLSFNYEFEALAMIGYVNALAGNKQEAYQIIREIESQSTNQVNHSVKLARIYGVLGEKDRAFEFLEQSLKKFEIDLTSFISDPRWNSLSSDPRFKDLSLRIGFLIK